MGFVFLQGIEMNKKARKGFESKVRSLQWKPWRAGIFRKYIVVKFAELFPENQV